MTDRMLFVKLYRFFRERKALLWTIMGVSAAVFGVYASKARFEEDMSKLLPSDGPAESGLVFGNLKVKDKIFVQMTGAPAEEAAALMDELMDSVSVHCKDIANTLYRIDAETALGALDYVMDHVPSFVDPSMYGSIDEAVADVDSRMERNADIVMNDWTGNATQAVATDPLGLRELFIPEIGGGSLLGFTVKDSHLFSEDGTVVLSFISPDFQSFDSASGSRLIGQLEDVVTEFESRHPGIDILYHGAPVRSAGNSRVMKKDIALTIGLSLLVILVILCISFRSFRIIWQNIVPVAYGAVFALAMMYWTKGGMSLMALGIGTVVLGVALSYCLHVIIHLRFTGDIEKMLSDESKPVILGCLTTIGAFLGLLFTKSELLRDFGLFGTFTLVGNTFFALVFLPHMLREKDTARNQRIFRVVRKVNDFPYDRNPWIVGAITVLVAVGIIFSSKVGFDNNLKHIGYEGEKLLRSEALYNEKCSEGGLQRYYAAVAPETDDAIRINSGLTALLDSLKEEGLIESFTPLSSRILVSTGDQQSRIDSWNGYWTEGHVSEVMGSIEASAGRFGLYKGMFRPFKAVLEGEYEPGEIFSGGVIPDGLLCNIMEESEGNTIVFNSTVVDPERRKEVDDDVAAMPGAVVVDPFYYTGNMIDLIKEDFNTTLMISSIFVLIVLLLSFRSVWISIIAFLPMFLSWYVVEGWMAIFGLEFNLINIVVSTFIFGIGVDYSIFVMQGLIAGARGEGDSLLEYHKAAIFFSALVLMIVTVAMLLATHPAIRSIGISTIIGMTSTILLTYSLEPLLFRLALKVPLLKKTVEKK